MRQIKTTIKAGNLGVDGVKFSENALNELAGSLRELKVITNSDEKMVVGHVFECERRGDEIDITVVIDRATTSIFDALILQDRLTGGVSVSVEDLHFENGALVIDRMEVVEVSLILKVFNSSLAPAERE